MFCKRHLWWGTQAAWANYLQQYFPYIFNLLRVICNTILHFTSSCIQLMWHWTVWEFFQKQDSWSSLCLLPLVPLLLVRDMLHIEQGISSLQDLCRILRMNWVVEVFGIWEKFSVHFILVLMNTFWSALKRDNLFSLYFIFM